MNSNIKIIAEIASAHGGNISELKRLISESSKAKLISLSCRYINLMN